MNYTLRRRFSLKLTGLHSPIVSHPTTSIPSLFWGADSSLQKHVFRIVEMFHDLSESTTTVLQSTSISVNTRPCTGLEQNSFERRTRSCTQIPKKLFISLHDRCPRQPLDNDDKDVRNRVVLIWGTFHGRTWNTPLPCYTGYCSSTCTFWGLCGAHEKRKILSLLPEGSPLP